MTIPETGLIGSSELICLVRDELDCALRSNASVLITGERGVRKRALARFIHGQSTRASSPLISLDCSSEADDILEARLTGHARSAPGGTLVLHCASRMSLELQTRFLGFLETGDVRTVTTDRTLYEETLTGGFREDLYYRLNTIHIELPPLRERKEDVGTLVRALVRKFSTVHHTPRLRFSDHVLQAMTDYSWPGNVAELENAVEGLVVSAQSDTVQFTDLPLPLQSGLGRR